MSRIKKHIESENSRGRKVLSVFLTAGFPSPETFVELASKILDAGADMLEIGFPFSDPLADGTIIQHSSNAAIRNGINLQKTFQYVEQIKKQTDKPVILMGYANPVIGYGLKKFSQSCKETGVDGIIIPDVPLEEYENFFTPDFEEIDIILLISPTTSNDRVKVIDEKSEGFVYCVSVSGTTGNEGAEKDTKFIKESYSLIRRNKMLVGFGISSPEDAKRYSQFSDGVIVGSALIKSLINDNPKFDKTLHLVSELKSSL